MSSPIDFYFDFSSPYGYLAAEQIDDLAAKHGRAVVWRPILLGVVFQQTGSQRSSCRSPFPSGRWRPAAPSTG